MGRLNTKMCYDNKEPIRISKNIKIFIKTSEK